MDEATTKKLTEWKIVAKAVQGDKKATHAANSFNCLFYTTRRATRRGNKKRGSRSAVVDSVSIRTEQVRCVLKDLARGKSLIQREK